MEYLKWPEDLKFTFISLVHTPFAQEAIKFLLCFMNKQERAHREYKPLFITVNGLTAPQNDQAVSVYAALEAYVQTFSPIKRGDPHSDFSTIIKDAYFIFDEDWDSYCEMYFPIYRQHYQNYIESHPKQNKIKNSV